MSDFKLKKTEKNIKFVDKSKILSERIINNSLKLNNSINKNFNAQENGETPEEYATNNTQRKAKDIAKSCVNFDRRGSKNRINKESGKINNINKYTKHYDIKRGKNNSEKAYKGTNNLSKKTIKTTKNVRRNTQTMKATFKATVNSAKAVFKATVTSVKAVVTGSKALIAAIVAGGWISVIIIVSICLIGLIAGSCFGIFFSNEDTNTNSISMSQVITKLNNEYIDTIKNVQIESGADSIEIISNDGFQDICWKDVIVVYAVKNSNGNKSEVVTIDNEKEEELRKIMFEMNSFTYSTKSVIKNIDVTDIDENGNETIIEKSVTETILTVNLTHKSYTEMTLYYGFNQNQIEQIETLRGSEYDSIWDNMIGENSLSYLVER